MRGDSSVRTANVLVTMSLATTAVRIGQKSRAFLSLSIFFALLALDAIPRVRQRIEPLECDVLATIVALPERLGRLVQPPQRLIDMPQEPAFLTREEKRFLPLHRVGSLIR